MGTLVGVYHLLLREYNTCELNQGNMEWAQSENKSYYLASIDYKNRKISLRDSLGYTEIRELTFAGNLKRSQDATGDSKEISYDALLRVRSISEKGSHKDESRFSYDQNKSHGLGHGSCTAHGERHPGDPLPQ